MSAQRYSPGGIPTVTVQEALERLGSEQPALLVDVREQDEFLELRAVSAILMPLSQFGSQFAELPKDRPLLMVCHSGGRSGRATAFLLQQGYSDVCNVEGGMLAWKRAEQPMRSGPLDPGEGDL